MTCVLLTGEQALDAVLYLCRIKLVFLDEELAQLIEVRLGPLDGELIGIGDGGADKHCAQFVDGVLIRDLEALLLAQCVDNGLQIVVFADQVEGVYYTNAFDAVGVVAAAKDAEICELGHGEVEVLQDDGQREFDGLDALFRGGGSSAGKQVADETVGAKRERVHVLASSGPDNALLDELGALGLCLAGRLDDRDAHEGEELLAGFGHLRGNAVDTSGKAGSGLHVTVVAGLLRSLFGGLFGVGALCKLAGLHGGGLAVEDEGGLHAELEEPDNAVEEAAELGGDITVVVGEVVGAHADGDEELVDAHGGIDGNLAAKEGLGILGLDGARGVVTKQLGETLDSHDGRGGVEVAAQGEEGRGGAARFE